MQPRDELVRVGQVNLHYRAWGATSQPLVVLLHGGTAHAGWWDFFAPQIADRFHVVAVDLRGHGDSEHGTPAEYRIADYVADLQALALQLPSPRFHLIGHSLGGIIAGAFAAASPERLLSLATVDTGLRMSPAGSRYLARLRHFPQPHFSDRATAIRRFRLMPRDSTAAPEVLEHVAAQALRQCADGRWTLKFDRQTLAQIDPIDVLPGLTAGSLPLLLIRGELSGVLLRQRVEEMCAVVPRAISAEVAGAYHHVMLDNPPEFARVVSAFLDRHRNVVS